MVQAVFALVGLMVSGLVIALAIRIRGLGARVRRLERDAGDLSSAVASARDRTAEELKALGGQVTAIYVNQAAEQIGERLAEKRTRRADPSTTLEEDRPTLEIVRSSSDDAPCDDETTHVASRPARRVEEPPPQRAPLAHPDLIGCEDIADEAARPRLGPDEVTPPRRGRAAILVPVFQSGEEGGAA